MTSLPIFASRWMYWAPWSINFYGSYFPEARLILHNYSGFIGAQPPQASQNPDDAGFHG